MNVALHLHKQGLKTRLISSVGNDENGEGLKSFLVQNGLPTENIQQHNSLPTGEVKVTLDEYKQATYTILKPVAWDEIASSPLLRKLVDESDAFIFGSLASRSALSYNTLLSLLKTSKCSIFDMNLRPPHFEISILETLMNQCDVLKINEHELDFLKTHYKLEHEVESQLINLSFLINTPTICLTLGDKGAMVFHQNEIYHHSGYKVTISDTVGAGDAFLGSFIAGFLQKQPMEQILSRACATGALVASKPGANPPYTQADIDNILQHPI